MQSTNYYAPEAAAKNKNKAGSFAVAALSLALAVIAVSNTVPNILVSGIMELVFSIATIILAGISLKNKVSGGKKVMAGFALALGILGTIGGLSSIMVAVFIGQDAILNFIEQFLTEPFVE